MTIPYKLADMPHPMQPVGYADDNVIRFKKNAIVRFLLDFASGHKVDLNLISTMPFPEEDYIQLMQLVGYSVSGFGELSMIPDDMIEKADEIATDMIELKKQAEGVK